MEPVNTAATNRRIAELITDIRDGALVPNPEFQRRLVWSSTHKAEFIRTVLLGLPFPEVFIAQGEVDVDSGDATEWLVDGQQRLTTLSAYFTGDLDISYGKFGISLYANLDEPTKRTFLQYQVAVRDLGAIDLTDVVTIFERINSTGYSLNAMEVNNARFDGPLKQFAESLPDWPVLDRNRVFTSRDAKRMNDVRYCLSLIITLMSDYFHRDSEHETYLIKYNDEFDERDNMETRLNQAFTVLDQGAFDPRGRAWRKADLFTLIVEIDRALQEGVSPDFGALGTFLDQVDEVSRATKVGDGSIEAETRVLQYIDSSIQGVNDRGNRLRRGEILGAVLRGEPDKVDS